ncbi:MAG: STAS domain-containing protein [Blastomonas sp.]
MRIIELPEHCDRAATELLVAEMTQAVHEGDVTINGSAVARIGQAMLQLLLSAVRTARGLDRTLVIQPSEAMDEAMRLAGVETAIMNGAAA